MPNIARTTVVASALQFAFLQRLSIAHDRSIRAIASLDQGLLCTEAISAGWTIKDILGHVVTWNDEFRRAIQDILRKEKPRHVPALQGEVDFDEWNGLKIDTKRRWSWKRIRADLDRDYDEAVELILHLRAGEFRKRGITPWVYAPPKEMAKFMHGQVESVETLVTYHWRHQNQHSRMIEEWRERNGNSF